MNDLTKAKNELILGNHTCVLCRESKIYSSDARGVRPLVIWIESGNDLSKFSAADKVVGKATAFLYVMLDVSAVYAGVISRSALRVLEEHNINVEYGSLAENIINRQGNGICPFEASVLDIEDVDTAYFEIRKKMQEMNISL